MAIEKIPGGGIGITGPDIQLYRLMAMEKRVKMELKGLSFGGRSTTAILRQEFGWKERSKAAIHKKLLEKIEEVKKELGYA
jgi:hypothetical protein